jgi:hypothetical protein
MIVVAAALALGGRLVVGQQFAGGHAGIHHGAAPPAASPAVAAIIPGLTLPSDATTAPILEGAVHNSEFISLPVGTESLTAFVSYPDRAEKAPAVIVTADKQGMSDWARAVAYQLSRDGFIGVVPDYLSGLGPGGGDTDSFTTEEAIVDAMNRLSEEEIAQRALATRRYVTEIPSSNGTIARLDFVNGNIQASVGNGAPRQVTFPVTDEGWASALAFLSEQTGNHFEPTANHDHVAMEMRAQQAGRGGQPGRGAQAGQAREAPGLAEKPDDLPANWVMAEHVVATTPRKNEWVDVPVPNSTAKVHTWVVYPDGTGWGPWSYCMAVRVSPTGFEALRISSPRRGSLPSSWTCRPVSARMAATTIRSGSWTIG